MDVCGWKDKPEIQLCSSSRPFFFASCHGLIRRRRLAKERNNNWRFCQRTKENNTHTHTIKQTRRFFRISRINSARIDVDVNAPLSLHKETNFKNQKKGDFFFFVFLGMSLLCSNTGFSRSTAWLHSLTYPGLLSLYGVSLNHVDFQIG